MKSIRIASACAVAALSWMLQGCAHTASTDSAAPATNSAAPASASGSADKKDNDLPGGIIGTIPARSPFAKLTVGMTKEDVDTKLGPPTNQRAYPTGKMFIPFYMGDDRTRMEYRYKGQGVVTFSSGGGWNAASNFTVFRVVYDPSETGVSN